jgi:predicted RNA-binding protein with PUA-like domain
MGGGGSLGGTRTLDEPMNYWLSKSEPFKYSWNEFVKDKRTYWDGVRNYEARNNLKAMAKGDQVLFYHSNEGMEVVGIAKVVKEFYQDPTTEDDRWVVVDLKPIRALKNPVTLKQMKADPRLVEMKLVRQGRLSVSPVTEDEFNAVLDLSR